MNRSLSLLKTVVLASALVLGIASPVTTFASDPDFDVSVCEITGAPGCSLVDGAIMVSNQSTVYWYKLDLSISCSVSHCYGCNTSNSKSVTFRPKLCQPNSNPGCNDTVTCLFPNCATNPGPCIGCTPATCDNTFEDCDTATMFCTNITGKATATAWSTDGVSWTNFEGTLEEYSGSECTVGPCN